MKALIIIGLALLILFMITQAFTYKNTAQTEIQPYEVTHKEGDFELRFYPSSVIASVTKAGDYEAMRSAGFRDLAGYIFGGNNSGQKIAMTSPVIMQESQETTRMSFVMPKAFKQEDLPLPNNKNVSFETTVPTTIAVYRFGGFASSSEIRKAETKLAEWIETKGLEHSNDFIFMAYNPPYQLINRRNEVGVGLRGKLD